MGGGLHHSSRVQPPPGVRGAGRAARARRHRPDRGARFGPAPTPCPTAGTGGPGHGAARDRAVAGPRHRQGASAQGPCRQRRLDGGPEAGRHRPEAWSPRAGRSAPGGRVPLRVRLLSSGSRHDLECVLPPLRTHGMGGLRPVPPPDLPRAGHRHHHGRRLPGQVLRRVPREGRVSRHDRLRTVSHQAAAHAGGSSEAGPDRDHHPRSGGQVLRGGRGSARERPGNADRRADSDRRVDGRGLDGGSFPHWVHRIRYRCKTCHMQIFEPRQGANRITMADIGAGQACGVCHDGQTAFASGFGECERCHVAPTPPAAANPDR